MSALTPARVRVRMYQVGFGDCFLITVEYTDPDTDGRAERHVLVDFGSTRPPRNAKKSAMTDIAELIAAHTHGKLDVVVLTHRHKDHLSGFGIDAAKRILTDLKPSLVLRPWTEAPLIDDDATGPPDGPGVASRNFVRHLGAAQAAAGRIADADGGLRGLQGDLGMLALEQVKNLEAIETLDGWADGDKGRYLNAGASLHLDDLIPGLKATVLGPPTLEQDPRVAQQVSRNPEYWMVALRDSLDAAAPAEPPQTTPDDVPPGPVRWLVEHLTAQKSHSMTRLVRSLDDALNNTSLILLLEVGGVSMLLPGDAQIENWNWTLDKLANDEELKNRLTAIDLYKVGHHGSRNATPRSLHALWKSRLPDAPPLTALMSTRTGVHGKTAATKVPRQTLVNALKEVADLHSTADLNADQKWIEVVSDAAGGPFRLVNPA